MYPVAFYLEPFSTQGLDSSLLVEIGGNDLVQVQMDPYDHSPANQVLLKPGGV